MQRNAATRRRTRIGPFRAVVETREGKRVLTFRLTPGQVKQLPPEQRRTLNIARSERMNMRVRINGWMRQGFISKPQRVAMQRYIFQFMLTPRTEEGKLIHRVPTFDELLHRFPAVARALSKTGVLR